MYVVFCCTDIIKLCDCRLTMKQMLQQTSSGELKLPIMIESCTKQLHFNVFFYTLSRKEKILPYGDV